MSDSVGYTPGATPSGPDEGPTDPTSTPPPAVSSPVTHDSASVTKSRHTIGRLALVLPIAGLAIIVLSTIVWIAVELSPLVVDGFLSVALAVLSVLGPVLLVLGGHMVVWRALVRPLARMDPGARIGTIVGVGAVLAFISVPLVALLVFVGFSVISPILDAVGGLS